MLLFARIAVTLLAAASLTIIAPPINLHWLHWFALAPMVWVMREDTPRSNRWLAFLYGTASTAMIFRWLGGTIMTFSNLSPLLAVIAVLLFSMIFGFPWVLLWSSVHPLRRRLGGSWVLAFAALQVVLEYAQMLVFLFPYNHGVSQYRAPWTWQIASVTGVAGITFLLFFVNAVVGEAILRHREGKKLPFPWFGAAAATMAATLAFGAWRVSHIEAILQEAPIVRVGVIQTDKTMMHRFSESRRRMVLDWIEATERITADNPDGIDIVVWSEGSSPYNVHEGQLYERLGDLARDGGFELFLGGGTSIRRDYPVTDEEWDAHRERDPNEYELMGRVEGESWAENYNSVHLFNDDGQIAGRYDKTIPLPFGEYIPLSGWFPILRTWIRGPGDFRAGTEFNTLNSKHAILGTPICYEAILPNHCRRYVGAELLLNPTNDAWFAEPGPQLHAMLATGRAIELGIPLVRSAFTGVSMVVEPHGRIIHEVPPFVADETVVNVRKASLNTVYKRFGDWFTAFCALLLISLLFAAPWLNRQPQDAKKAPDPAAQ